MVEGTTTYLTVMSTSLSTLRFPMPFNEKKHRSPPWVHDGREWAEDA